MGIRGDFPWFFAVVFQASEKKPTEKISGPGNLMLNIPLMIKVVVLSVLQFMQNPNELFIIRTTWPFTTEIPLERSKEALRSEIVRRRVTFVVGFQVYWSKIGLILCHRRKLEYFMNRHNDEPTKVEHNFRKHFDQQL